LLDKYHKLKMIATMLRINNTSFAESYKDVALIDSRMPAPSPSVSMMS